MICRTNAEAILGMAAENILDVVRSLPGDDLTVLACRDCPAVAQGRDAADEDCEKCLVGWLQQPYAGEFAMKGGQIVVKGGDGHG